MEYKFNICVAYLGAGQVSLGLRRPFLVLEGLASDVMKADIKFCRSVARLLAGAGGLPGSGPGPPRPLPRLALEA